MTEYTPEKIRERREEERALGFDLSTAFLCMSDTEISERVNGVGPDAMPRVARTILRDLAWYFDLPSDCHDIDFSVSDGGRYSFAIANYRIYHNARICIKARRGRLNPLRYIELWRCHTEMALLNGELGWEAWQAAAKKYR